MNENNMPSKDKIFFIFNDNKESINSKIEKSFEIFIKNLVKDNKEH